MTATVYRCPRCTDTSIYHDYGLRILVCTKCKAPLKVFKEG
ncbi:MAG: hypothetical protein ACETVP_04900 [Candidatus Bathyarchaeia archaeon]